MVVALCSSRASAPSRTTEARIRAFLATFVVAFGCAGDPRSQSVSEGPGRPPPQGPTAPPRVPAGTSGEDLRKLPKAPPWQTDEPIREVPDLRREPLPGRSPIVMPTTVDLDLSRLPTTGKAPRSIALSPSPDSPFSLVSLGRSIAAYDRAGRIVAGPWLGSSLWRGSPSSCAAAASAPANVIFDRAASRWLVSRVVSTKTALHLCVAVARGADAVRSGWYLYDFILPGSRAEALELVGDAYSLIIDPGRGGKRLTFDRHAMLEGAGATFRPTPAPDS